MKHNKVIGLSKQSFITFLDNKLSKNAMTEKNELLIISDTFLFEMMT